MNVFDLLQQEFGAVIVVPSGNGAKSFGRRSKIDTFPALLSLESLRADYSGSRRGFVVAGAVDTSGFKASFAQTPDTTVFAPGSPVICRKNGTAAVDAGTSFSVGMVSSPLDSRVIQVYLYLMAL